MARSGLIRIRDLRAAYRVLGDCRELAADPLQRPLAWRERMLEGLLRLAGGRVALSTFAHNAGTPKEIMTSPVAIGLDDASDRARWAEYQRTNAFRDNPVHRSFYAPGSRVLRTRTLPMLVPVDRWKRTWHYSEFAGPLRFGDRVMSSLRLTPTEAESTSHFVIVIHRATDDAAFDQRTARLVNLFHRELRSVLQRRVECDGGRTQDLVHRDLARGQSVDLPKRLRQVLDGLLRGDAEKQIAFKLGISRHTVSRHVQRLYKHFDVSSRGELHYACRQLCIDDLVASDD